MSATTRFNPLWAGFLLLILLAILLAALGAGSWEAAAAQATVPTPSGGAPLQLPPTLEPLATPTPVSSFFPAMGPIPPYCCYSGAGLLVILLIILLMLFLRKRQEGVE